MSTILKRKNQDSTLNKRSLGEKIVIGIVFVIFFLYAASLIYPFIWLIINSLKDGLEYEIHLMAKTPFELPATPLFSNYIKAFTAFEYNDTNFYGMFFNSIWYVGISTFNGVFASCLTGYCVSKYKFRLRGVLYGIAIFSMTIPILGTTAATFKLVSALNIYDSPLYVVLTTFGGFGFNFLIMYGFFQNISWSYAEAVFIDGGGHFTVFFKIMLPQAIAPITTLCLKTAIEHWNAYEAPILFIPHFPTVSSGLYFIEKSLSRDSMPLYYAALFLAALPVLTVFVTFSNKIMQNVSVGGLKG